MVETFVLVDVNQPLPWFFTRWLREDSFLFLEYSEEHQEHVGIQAVFAIFSTGSQSFSCQDYENYEFGGKGKKLVSNLRSPWQFANGSQARNRIGFHCFTEIGQIRHNRYIFNNNKKDLQGFIREE